MRDIEFRGKRVKTGEWIYGYLASDDEICDINEIATPRRDVDKDTIGEYTGCNDKYGKKIYEGDIVECVSWNEYFTNAETGDVMQPFRRKMYVSFRNGGFKMVEPMPYGIEPNVWDIIYNGDVKIIGNIHDNPEFIKNEETYE